MRSDVHPRVSVCQFSTYGWNFYEDVIRYSTLGFDSIGLWRRKINDLGAAAAVDLLYETKMSVSSIHWAGGFTGDGRSFSDAIEDAIESIQLASQMNAGCLIIHPGSRNGHTTTHANRLLHSAISTLVPVASDYGVKLALEPMISRHATAWTFLNRFDETFKVMEQFPADVLGWVFDTYHYGFDAELFERLNRYIDRLELVQLADRNLLLEHSHKSRQGNDSFRLPLGNGQVPMEAWLSKLQRLGYTGSYEVEIHGSTVEGNDYHQLLESTAGYFATPKLDALMHARPRVEGFPMPQRINQRLVD